METGASRYLLWECYYECWITFCFFNFRINRLCSRSPVRIVFYTFSREEHSETFNSLFILRIKEIPFVHASFTYKKIMNIMKEFRTLNFGLNHGEPERFVTSQWGHPRLYLSWRIFWALFHASWLVSSMVSPPGGAVWFIYLTNWTYLLLTISAVLDAVIVLFVRINRQDIIKGFTSHLPWYLKVSWLLNSVVTEASLHISAIYWSFLFNYQSLTLLRFVLHGMNSIYVFCNLLVVNMPVHVYHVIYPVIYGVVYTVFSVVYHILGGTNEKGEPYIYKILDWSKLKRTLPLVFLSTFVALPCLYLVVFFIHKLRIHVHSKCLKNNSLQDTSILDSSMERFDVEGSHV